MGAGWRSVHAVPYALCGLPVATRHTTEVGLQYVSIWLTRNFRCRHFVSAPSWSVVSPWTFPLPSFQAKLFYVAYIEVFPHHRFRCFNVNILIYGITFLLPVGSGLLFALFFLSDLGCWKRGWVSIWNVCSEVIHIYCYSEICFRFRQVVFFFSCRKCQNMVASLGTNCRRSIWC